MRVERMRAVPEVWSCLGHVFYIPWLELNFHLRSCVAKCGAVQCSAWLACHAEGVIDGATDMGERHLHLDNGPLKGHPLWLRSCDLQHCAALYNSMPLSVVRSSMYSTCEYSFGYALFRKRSPYPSDSEGVTNG